MTQADIPTSVDPWIGDRSAGVGCGFALTQADNAPRCGQPVAVHVVAESVIHGLVRLSTCPDHAAIARKAGPVHSEHTPRDTQCLSLCDQEDPN
jgi:hypothetical protein